MNGRKRTARTAGFVYFVFMIVAILVEFVFPRFVVLGDAAATARNIAAAENTYRVGILLGFVTHAIFIVLVAFLYKLLREVDETHALVMVLLVTVGVAVALANMLNRFAPLVLAAGADYLSVFSKPQLEALALESLRFHSTNAAFPMLFWGLWLFPFGLLVKRSTFLPAILGVLLIVAGCGYLVTGVTAIVFPESRESVSRYMMPFYFGEVPIVFWLAIKGAKAPAEAGPERRST